MTAESLKQLSDRVGDAFHMLDSKRFRRNFAELKSEF